MRPQLRAAWLPGLWYAHAHSSWRPRIWYAAGMRGRAPVTICADRMLIGWYRYLHDQLSSQILLADLAWRKRHDQCFPVPALMQLWERSAAVSAVKVWWFTEISPKSLLNTKTIEDPSRNIVQFCHPSKSGPRLAWKNFSECFSVSFNGALQAQDKVF